MKKKCIQYRLDLFIVLFSLSTLSSCVNTKQGLGLDRPSGLQEEQNDRALGMDDSSRQELGGQQEEQADNTHSSQDTSRFGLIRNNFWSIVRPLGEINGESLLGIGEGFAAICFASYYLGHYIGYQVGYGPGYAAGSLHAYPGPGL